MFNFTEQFNASNKEAIDTATRFAQLALESTERLIKLQIETVRTTLEENAKTLQAVAAANSAFDNLNKMAKQATDMTEAGVNTVTNAAVKAAGKKAAK